MVDFAGAAADGGDGDLAAGGHGLLEQLGRAGGLGDLAGGG